MWAIVTIRLAALCPASKLFSESAGDLFLGRACIVQLSACFDMGGPSIAELAFLKKLLACQPGSIIREAVGPKDLLYMSAALITFHRVFSDSDVLGMSCHLLTAVDLLLLP